MFSLLSIVVPCSLKNHIIPGVQATKEKLKDGMCLASYHE